MRKVCPMCEKSTCTGKAGDDCPLAQRLTSALVDLLGDEGNGIVLRVLGYYLGVRFPTLPAQIAFVLGSFIEDGARAGKAVRNYIDPPEDSLPS